MLINYLLKKPVGLYNAGVAALGDGLIDELKKLYRQEIKRNGCLSQISAA